MSSSINNTCVNHTLSLASCKQIGLNHGIKLSKKQGASRSWQILAMALFGTLVSFTAFFSSALTFSESGHSVFVQGWKSTFEIFSCSCNTILRSVFTSGISIFLTPFCVKGILFAIDRIHLFQNSSKIDNTNFIYCLDRSNIWRV